MIEDNLDNLIVLGNSTHKLIFFPVSVLNNTDISYNI